MSPSVPPGMESCYVCGMLQMPFRLMVRDGRRVCRDVQACTEQVMNPPPMWHTEFITDEAINQMALMNHPGVSNIYNVIDALRPELRGAEIQVMRDEMRCGWKVRAKRVHGVGRDPLPHTPPTIGGARAMTMCKLYYVACDECGTPCGGDEQMADTIREARAAARAYGGWAVRSVHGRDLCPECRRRQQSSEVAK